MTRSRPLVRPRGAPAIVALGLVVALAGCSSDNGPTPPDESIIPAAIQAQIDALFPSGNLNDSATDQVEGVLESADAGQTAQAQSAFVDFVAFGAAQAGAGALLDPNGTAAPTIEVALATLSDDVAGAAGLTAVLPIPAGAFGEGGAAEVVDGSGGTVVTNDGNAGLQLPAGALPGRTLVTIEPLPATGDPLDHDGPLLTSLDQYPRFYSIELFPPVTLAQEGVVGLCVVDPPDPFAPTPQVAARLRVAHTDPQGSGGIEILPLAAAPFLDCDGGSGSLSPASPGAIGGRISAFSPFAAVDPAGSPPSITSVTPNPIHASVAGGSDTPFTVGYADSEGDIVLLRLIEVSDPQNALDVGDVPVDDLAVGTSGSFLLNAGCSVDPPAACQTGTALVDFILVDAAGNESDAFRVTVIFE